VAKVWKWALAAALVVGACAKSQLDQGEPPIHVTPDAGVDAGPPDAGPPDAGPPDAGPPDAGPADAGPTAIFGTPGPWPVANVSYGFADGIQESPVVGVSTDEPILATDGGVTQNLWIATNWALYLMRPGEKTAHRFDSNDGLHLQDNAVEYCADRDFEDGDKSCRSGAAWDPGISEIVGGGPNEVFVGYWGHHDWTDTQHDGDWFDVYRHTGKLDRVRIKTDSTGNPVPDKDGKIVLDVARFDMVSGNTPRYWHNRTVYRMVYDHFIHKHELYVGAEHGIDKFSPDKYFPPKNKFVWPFIDNLYWMSDHLHPVTCKHQQCTGNESRDVQMMGEWRGLALTPEGDLWVGGKWSAGKIFYTPLNAELNTNGIPNGDGKTGWFQRGGDSFKDPKTGLNYSFGNIFCGTNGVWDVWTATGWQTQSCSPMSGTPPVFWPPAPGDPVGISAVAVTPDGKSWWASGPFGGDPAYGLASFDGHRFKYFDPISDAGMLEYIVVDMVALPDGRLVLGSQTTGLTFWDPDGKKRSQTIRAGQGIPDDHIMNLELDTMVNPPALHVATRGGAAVLRVLP
jgi:hypothetical protein